VPSVADDPVMFTATLRISRETVYFLARLLHQRRSQVGTRRGARVLGPFRQAVLVLRWFLDAARVAQLAADNAIALSTAYTRLHEGIDVLAALAPDIHEALLAAKAAGATHVNLDGTLIHTDRVATAAPTAQTCGGAGNTGTTAATSRSCRTRTASQAGSRTYAPAANRTPPARERTRSAGRPHRVRGRTRNADADRPGLPEPLPGHPPPAQETKGGELTEAQTTYNKLIRGVHGVAERANALLKETFAALQRVSLDPSRIGAITRAALVLLHLEHHRPLPGGYTA
jgi:hypothetical protein